MVETPFDIKAREDANPRPKDLEDNEKWNPLCPRKEVREAYKEVGYTYEKMIHDRVADDFYDICNGRPMTQEISQIARKRIPLQGEFIIINTIIRGEDWKGNKHDFELVDGKYELPIFKKDRDPETNKTTTNQIQDHKTMYDIPWSKETFNKLIESAAEPLGLIVYGSAGRRHGVQNIDDFRDADYDDLIQVGNTGKSLQTVKAERNQFSYEKRETKKP